MLAIAALFAGCLDPFRPETQTAPAASLVATTDVDLLSHQLQITMPGANASALVLLHVTKEMWVHWRIADQEDEAWSVCVLIETFASITGLRVGLFEVKENQIEIATPGYPMFNGANFTAGATPEWRHVCITPVARDPGFAPFYDEGFYATEPRDTTLAVIVTTRWYPDATIAPFQLNIGVGKQACPGHDPTPWFGWFDYYCPPAEVIPLEPTIRGTSQAFAASNTPVYCFGAAPSARADAARACTGFETHDSRTLAGPAASGTVTSTHVRSTIPGLTVTYAFAWGKISQPPMAFVPTGVNRLALKTQFDEATVTLECTRPAASTILLAAVGPSGPGATTEAMWDTHGTTDFAVYSADIGLDLAAHALTVKPAQKALTVTPVGQSDDAPCP